MTNNLYNDWRQEYANVLETKLVERDNENMRLRKALEEIKQTVIAGQNPIYPFVIYLDSKDGAFILETANNALKGKDE